MNDDMTGDCELASGTCISSGPDDSKSAKSSYSSSAVVVIVGDPPLIFELASIAMMSSLGMLCSVGF